MRKSLPIKYYRKYKEQINFLGMCVIHNKIIQCNVFSVCVCHEYG